MSEYPLSECQIQFCVARSYVKLENILVLSEVEKVAGHVPYSAKEHVLDQEKADIKLDNPQAADV